MRSMKTKYSRSKPGHGEVPNDSSMRGSWGSWRRWEKRRRIISLHLLVDLLVVVELLLFINFSRLFNPRVSSIIHAGLLYIT